MGIYAAALILLLIGANLPESMKNPDLPDIIHNPFFACIMYGGMLLSVTAAFLSLKTIFKDKERAVLTFVSLFPGALFACGAVLMLIMLIAGMF